MQNSGPMVILGSAIMIVAALNILVPYLRGKSDILTAWNILWLGGAIFTGIGSLAVAYGDFHWPELKWFQPTKQDVQNYIIGSIAFYGTMLVTYYVFSWPQKFSLRFFRKWPPPSFSLLVSALCLFGAIAVCTNFALQVVVLGALLSNVAHKAIVFAVVFGFCYWYRDKRHLLKLAIFIVVFALAALDAMVLFAGRRLLLSVAVAPLICMYWLHWRYLPPTRNLVRVGLAAFLGLAVVAFYSTFRRFDLRAGGPGERTFATTLQAMKQVSAQDAVDGVTRDAYFYFANYAVHYSLLTIHLVESGEVPVEPLHSLAYIATYPIPRVLFPAKPELLSIRLVRDVLRMPYKTNWGLGIVGTGYHEGGVPVIILYAVMIVLLCRLVDDPLARQPDNPFLLGVLCVSVPHLAALIRGDCANMSVEVLESFAFVWALGLIARFLFGTAAVQGPPGTASRAYPQLRGQYRHAGR